MARLSSLPAGRGRRRGRSVHPRPGIWESEADSGFRGRLNPFFVQRLVDANSKADEAMESRSRVRHSRPLLWSDRPQEPWRTSVEALKSVQRFEDAVDLVREAQRGILEKRAWVKMAAAWIQEGGSLETLKKGVVVPANDDFMGAWIHEITELDLYFLLTKAAVPCFFVHELTDGEPPSELVATDFVKWTAVAPRLDPEYCPYNRLVASSANGQFTALEESLVTVGIPDRTHEDRLRSSGRWQFGLHVPDQLPACRFLFEDGRPRSQSVVSVEDARESSVLSLGPEDEEMEDVQVVEPPVVEPPSPNKKATVNVRPQVFAATLTYPSLESTVLTPFLKFPDLNDVFTPNDVRTWLDGANRKVPGCGWRRVLRVARKPRVDYYVEFESAEAALKIRGLIEPREGEIREGYFVGETEFKKIAALSPAVLQQTRNAAETAPASEPYAGGGTYAKSPLRKRLRLDRGYPSDALARQQVLVLASWRDRALRNAFADRAPHHLSLVPALCALAVHVHRRRHHLCGTETRTWTPCTDETCDRDPLRTRHGLVALTPRRDYCRRLLGVPHRVRPRPSKGIAGCPLALPPRSDRVPALVGGIMSDDRVPALVGGIMSGDRAPRDVEGTPVLPIGGGLPPAAEDARNVRDVDPRPAPRALIRALGLAPRPLNDQGRLVVGERAVERGKGEELDLHRRLRSRQRRRPRPAC
ncbi:hypothetical protein B0H13DRAFT_2393349 [Mycena leptocephala]|nr:hypothetical protein B0H13DRAFT_2393349 [Mycena leptocephala]